MKKTALILLLVVLSSPLLLSHDPVLRARTPVQFPDILGFKTLKCDFHIHTVFSDGAVWPDVRSEEAWREGLDAIAITDHLEYLPHKADLPPNHDRSWEIAQGLGEKLQITVIRGSEITRQMPPGHLNAIFIQSAKPLETTEWRDATRLAREQGAFIFWNHPGWDGQQPDGIARWYPEHTELVEKGQLHGIEVANGREYYPEAHRWCLEKKLTMLSNSDVHAPANLDYAPREGDHRPLTLVLARDMSAEAIREALFARRTLVYTGHLLIGEEQYLRPMFETSVSFLDDTIQLRGTATGYLQIRNSSELDIRLRLLAQVEGFVVPKEITLAGTKTVLFAVKASRSGVRGTHKLKVRYLAENLLIAPETGLPVELEFEVRLD